MRGEAQAEGNRQSDGPGGHEGQESLSRSSTLRRSVHNRYIAGVCGGIAEFLGIDATVVRVLYVLLSILSKGFPGVIVYLVLWAVIPKREYY